MLSSTDGDELWFCVSGFGKTPFSSQGYYVCIVNIVNGLYGWPAVWNNLLLNAYLTWTELPSINIRATLGDSSDTIGKTYQKTGCSKVTHKNMQNVKHLNLWIVSQRPKAYHLKSQLKKDRFY